MALRQARSRHRRARGGGGRITNTSSTAGRFAAPGQGHYSAAKHGVIGLTKTLATELAGDGITVNAACPTAVHTSMTSDIADRMPDYLTEVAPYTQPDTLFGEILQPEDVTAAFMWLSSEDARFVTGIAAGRRRGDGGLTAPLVHPQSPSEGVSGAVDP